MKRASDTSYDEHMLLVAAGNLHKALSRAPKAVRVEVPLSGQSSRALHLLRNIYEHWEKFRVEYRSGRPLTQAAQKLRSEFSRANPWSLTFDPSSGEIVIADIVPLTPLWKELRLLEARMYASIKAARHGSNSGPLAGQRPDTGYPRQMVSCQIALAAFRRAPGMIVRWYLLIEDPLGRHS